MSPAAGTSRCETSGVSFDPEAVVEMEPRRLKLQGRQVSKSAISLVDWTVQVSSTLARLIRKCATAEAGGASAHDALLASAGVRAGEIEALRGEKGQCEGKLSHAQEQAAQLQRALDQAQDLIAQHDKELDDLRREIREAAETDKGRRNLITALRVRVGELQTQVANHEVHLMNSIATDGLDEAAVMALKALRHGRNRGEDLKVMVLVIGAAHHGNALGILPHAAHLVAPTAPRLGCAARSD
jgi:chromosome segregation ATPase